MDRHVGYHQKGSRFHNPIQDAQAPSLYDKVASPRHRNPNDKSWDFFGLTSKPSPTLFFGGGGGGGSFTPIKFKQACLKRKEIEKLSWAATEKQKAPAGSTYLIKRSFFTYFTHLYALKSDGFWLPRFPVKRQQLYKPRYVYYICIYWLEKIPKCHYVNVRTTQAHTFAVTTSKSHKIRGHRGGFNENVGDIKGFRVQMQGFPGLPWLDLRQGSVCTAFFLVKLNCIIKSVIFRF